MSSFVPNHFLPVVEAEATDLTEALVEAEATD
jgi:hypothetical protein